LARSRQERRLRVSPRGIASRPDIYLRELQAELKLERQRRDLLGNDLCRMPNAQAVSKKDADCQSKIAPMGSSSARHGAICGNRLIPEVIQGTPFTNGIKHSKAAN
jgi:hypothetical protein